MKFNKAICSVLTAVLALGFGIEGIALAKVEAEAPFSKELLAAKPAKKKKSKRTKKKAAKTPAPTATPVPEITERTPEEEIKKVCSLMETKKRASYDKFLKGKARFEKQRVQYLKDLEKEVRRILAKPLKYTKEAVSILSEGHDPSRGVVSDLVQIIQAYGHPEWFDGENSESYKEFGDYISEELKNIEKQADRTVDRKKDVNIAGYDLKRDSIEVRFYSASKQIQINGCALDIADVITFDQTGKIQIDSDKLKRSIIAWDKLEFRPICINIAVNAADFEPTKIDITGAYEAVVKKTVETASSFQEPPKYYDTLDTYLDHELPSVCRPKKAVEEVPPAKAGQDTAAPDADPAPSADGGTAEPAPSSDADAATEQDAAASSQESDAETQDDQEENAADYTIE